MPRSCTLPAFVSADTDMRREKCRGLVSSRARFGLYLHGVYVNIEGGVFIYATDLINSPFISAKPTKLKSHTLTDILPIDCDNF